MLWFLELQIRRGRTVYTQVHIVNSNSRTSNCQCSLFSNPIIQILFISGYLAVPINPDKWEFHCTLKWVMRACTLIFMHKTFIAFFKTHSPSVVEIYLRRAAPFFKQLAGGVLPSTSGSNFRFVVDKVGFTLITSVLPNHYHSTKAPYSYFIHIPLTLNEINQLRALLKIH